MTADQDFSSLIDFTAYIDQLKSVTRMNGLFDGSRAETTGEHSWHAALSALLLSPYANFPVDVNKVVQMLLIHDLVEIEAGDTFVYDQSKVAQQVQAEEQAADKLFSRLPDAKAKPLRALWEEFEARQSQDAKFAKAIDRFLPLFSNIHNGGFSWGDHGITQGQVRKICQIIQDGSQKLWALADEMITEAVEKGYLLP